MTEAAGLDEPHSDTDLTGESAMTAGAAVADVDDDGDLDVYLTRVGPPNRLLLNDGAGVFTDRHRALAVSAATTPTEGSSAAAFADVDGDGDVDLVVTGAGRNGTTLYLNDGSGRFTDATTASGLDDLPALPEGTLAQMHGVTFADYDRTGCLDLLVTHWDDTIPAALGRPVGGLDRTRCRRQHRLRPSERGSPTAGSPEPTAHRRTGAGCTATRAAGASATCRPRSVCRSGEVLGFTGSFADVDADGWQDLLLTGDFCTSRLFRNVDGTRFEDVTAAAGVGTDENGMGSVVHRPERRRPTRLVRDQHRTGRRRAGPARAGGRVRLLGQPGLPERRRRHLHRRDRSAGAAQRGLGLGRSRRGLRERRRRRRW